MVTRIEATGPRGGGLAPRALETLEPPPQALRPPAGRYDAWRTAPPGATDPQVAGWVRALPLARKALERVALEAIGPP